MAAKNYKGLDPAGGSLSRAYRRLAALICPLFFCAFLRPIRLGEFAARPRIGDWRGIPINWCVAAFLVSASTVFAAQEPRSIAEDAMAAWRAGDAKHLGAIAHPELMRRCRTARIVEFYVDGKDDKKKALAAGSDADALALLCEALRSIVPRDERFEHIDRFVEVRRKNDLAIVVFESGVRRKSDQKIIQSSSNEVVLKQVGDEWRFLWSITAQLHIDLDWDPRK
jgi:hypothetical protein